MTDLWHFEHDQNYQKTTKTNKPHRSDDAKEIREQNACACQPKKQSNKPGTKQMQEHIKIPVSKDPCL